MSSLARAAPSPTTAAAAVTAVAVAIESSALSRLGRRAALQTLAVADAVFF